MRKNRHPVVSVLLCGLLLFESVVHGASGQGSANASTSSTATAQSGGDRARWLADHRAWREYQRLHPTSVFSFEQLSSIFAEQRDIERAVEAFTITQELSARWRDALTRAAQETEIDSLFADIVEVQEAYDELAAEYKRLAEDANSRGAGLFGMVASLAVNFVVSAIPGVGPVLGASVASGFNKALDGGNLGEVLFAMGLAAGASFVAQEVSEAILADAQPMTDGSPGPSQAALNRARAGATAAAFPVVQVGTEFERALFAVSSRTFSPAALAAASETRPRLTVVHAAPDLDQVLGNAFRRLAADLSGAGSAPVPSTRSDAFVGMAQARHTRSLSDRAWSAKQISGDFRPALSGDALLTIHADERQLGRLLEAYEIERDLIARARRGLERAAREAEAINLSADREEAIRAYEELFAEYKQLQEDIQNRGGGLFGAICGVVGSIVGTMLGGPLLGAAFAGAIGTMANGGNVGEALVSAGFNAGATYAYSVVVPGLHNVLAGSPADDGGQTSLNEMIDEELAQEIESFYTDPVLESTGDDAPASGAGAMRAAVGHEAPSPVPGGGASPTPVEPPRVDEAPLSPTAKPTADESTLDAAIEAGVSVRVQSKKWRDAWRGADEHAGPTIGPRPPLTGWQVAYLQSFGIDPGDPMFNHETFDVLISLTPSDIDYLNFYDKKKESIHNLRTIQENLINGRAAVNEFLRDLRIRSEEARQQRRYRRR